jgi:protein SCO1/2
MNRKLFIAFISVGVFLAAFVFLIQGRVFHEEETGFDENAVVLQEKTTGQAQLGGSFKLVDHEGIERTDRDYRGKLMLVYFGYSYCPDICPTALYNITQALEKLGNKAEEIQPLFITIDPQRDTVKHLALYVKNFHPSLRALTGDEKEIKEAMTHYKVYGQKLPLTEGYNDYLMDHSSIIYLMDRQGRFIEHFNHTTSPDVLEVALKKHI